MDESKRLRVLLDESGIEHKNNDTPINGVTSYMTTWHCTNGKLVSFIETEMPHATKLRIYNPTPEQAIAATVGNCTNLSKRLREVTGLRSFAELFGFSWTDGSDWSWHDVACAMADAIDAMVGVGTCRNVSDPPSGFLCSECGWGDFDEPTHLLKDAKHCPNCGKRIEVDE